MYVYVDMCEHTHVVSTRNMAMEKYTSIHVHIRNDIYIYICIFHVYVDICICIYLSLSNTCNVGELNRSQENTSCIWRSTAASAMSDIIDGLALLILIRLRGALLQRQVRVLPLLPFFVLLICELDQLRDIFGQPSDQAGSSELQACT